MRHLLNVVSIIGWVLLLAWVGFALFAPPSWWVSDADITVDDGMVGAKSPGVELTFTYEKNILVHWTKLLFKQTDDEWLPVCDLSGTQQEYSGSQVVKTTLDGLFEGRSCVKALRPGEYYVEADLEWVDGVSREKGVESNIFTLVPEPKGRAVPRVTDSTTSLARRYHLHPAASRVPWPLSLFIGRQGRTR